MFDGALGQHITVPSRQSVVLSTLQSHPSAQHHPQETRPELSAQSGSHLGPVGLLALDPVFMLPSGPVGIRGQGRAVVRSRVSGRAWVPWGLEDWREGGSEEGF